MKFFSAKKTTDPAVEATGVTKARRGIFARRLKVEEPKVEGVAEEKKVDEPVTEERSPVDETVEPVAKSVDGAEEVKPTEEENKQEPIVDEVQVETVKSVKSDASSKSVKKVEAVTQEESPGVSAAVSAAASKAESKADAEDAPTEVAADAADDELREGAEGAAVPDADTGIFCGCIDTRAFEAKVMTCPPKL